MTAESTPPDGHVLRQAPEPTWRSKANHPGRCVRAARSARGAHAGRRLSAARGRGDGPGRGGVPYGVQGKLAFAPDGA